MKKTSRRDLIKYGSLGPLCFGFAAPQIFGASAPRRRHFINIQGFGGWDSSWHHSPILVRDTNGLTDAVKTSSFYGVFPTPRFPDTQALAFDDHVVGIGMAGFTPSELTKLLLWRGLKEQGGHDNGNRNIQDGSLSGYASSYSTLIALALGQSPDYLRPLHYVQTTNTSAEFRSQVGFSTGPGIPINLANLGSWANLSAADPNDPINTANLQTLLDNTLVKLVGMQEKLKPATRQKYEEEFGVGYQSMKAIRNKNYATDPAYDFAPTMERYRTAVTNYISTILFGANTGEYAKASLVTMANLPTASSGMRSFLTTYFGANMDNLVYPYALADFLVRYDLSAVVDVSALFGDFHNGNDQDFLRVMASLACYRELLRSLSTTPVSSTSSVSLLDVTTVALSTEFDRTLNRYPDATDGIPGTNHSGTSSIILAGYGINSGRIVGARGTGPQGSYGSIGSFLQPLPIDYKTGKPSSSGKFANNTTVAPTLLKIFGQTQPVQQNIGELPVDAVIKTGHNGS